MGRPRMSSADDERPLSASSQGSDKTLDDLLDGYTDDKSAHTAVKAPAAPLTKARSGAETLSRTGSQKSFPEIDAAQAMARFGVLCRSLRGET